MTLAQPTNEAPRQVSAARARDHLRQLSAQGVGHRTASDAAKVPYSTIRRIAYGRSTMLQAQAEQRILAVTTVTAADGAQIDAGPTWALLDDLLACGYSRRKIASAMAGRPVRGLKISRARVKLSTAHKVARVHAALALADKAEHARALALLAELRDEFYRPDQILREMAVIASARGWAAPSFASPIKSGPCAGRMRKRDVQLLAEVHLALLGEEAA